MKQSNPTLSAETRTIADMIEPLPGEERKLIKEAVRNLVDILKKKDDPGPIALTLLQKAFLRLFRTT
jgi:hypothetical protein